MSDEDSGTRLGLTIAQTLAEQMRGRLGVESVSGEGSSFWVELPRIVGKKPLLNLLIVDDEQAIREVLAEGLEAFGYDTQTEGDPARAYETVERGSVGVAARPRTRPPSMPDQIPAYDTYRIGAMRLFSRQL